MTTTIEFITALFCQVDDQLAGLPKHPEAHLWPSEVVTLGLLHALKGGGNRPFYRWLTRDYRPLFPRLPERTRLFRLLKTHQDWTQAFLAAPTVLGVIDTYGIELIHPMREGRSPQQIGRKGVSNHRWMVGGKRCLVLNQPLQGVVCAIGGGPRPRHLQPPLVRPQTEFTPDNPAMIREACAAALLRAPAFAHGMNQFDAVGVDDPEYRQGGQEDLRSLLMGREEAKEAGALG